MLAAMPTGSAAILRQAACKGFVSKSRRHPGQEQEHDLGTLGQLIQTAWNQAQTCLWGLRVAGRCAWKGSGSPDSCNHFRTAIEQPVVSTENAKHRSYFMYFSLSPLGTKQPARSKTSQLRGKHKAYNALRAIRPRKEQGTLMWTALHRRIFILGRP